MALRTGSSDQRPGSSNKAAAYLELLVAANLARENSSLRLLGRHAVEVMLAKACVKCTFRGAG